jgi:hypothetical protein
MEWFGNTLEAISWLIQNFLGTPEQTIALLVGATGVSVITQVLKWLLKLEREKVVVGVFAFVSFLASVLDYIVTSGDLPPHVLGFNTALIMGVAQPLYFYVVKPLNKFLKEFRQYKIAAKNKVENIEAIEQVATIEEDVITDKNKRDDTATQVQIPQVVEAPKQKVTDF